MHVRQHASLTVKPGIEQEPHSCPSIQRGVSRRSVVEHVGTQIRASRSHEDSLSPMQILASGLRMITISTYHDLSTSSSSQNLA
ncbi:hypothetical protein CY34DRAFT_206807 [Suillus luteus UH-Slu-Lm8-n1]|uniref:Uncharacterized protein n=1 Tax=Suillus luteus UH-Slu-Lm8-n1 TaxID=930992 RepID=A0A0D0BDE1_9AGAM|nr:hypothetical protein CY34DRAFT_206807 [Suillus luteus UH-Slu-Lm8-n1]